MTFADMISWENHERYLQQLTSHLRMDPPQNYTRPTLQQVLKADRQVFMYLIRVGTQLKRLPNNTLDLGVKLQEALQSYEVGFHLLPLPKDSQRAEGPGHQPQPSGNTYGNKGQYRPQPYKGKGGKSGGKGKSKGGKSVMPKFLLGRDNTNMDPLEDGFVSTFSKESVQMHLQVVNANWDGTCVAGTTASHRMPRKTTTKRCDSETASATWLRPVRPSMNA